MLLIHVRYVQYVTCCIRRLRLGAWLLVSNPRMAARDYNSAKSINSLLSQQPTFCAFEIPHSGLQRKMRTRVLHNFVEVDKNCICYLSSLPRIGLYFWLQPRAALSDNANVSALGDLISLWLQPCAALSDNANVSALGDLISLWLQPCAALSDNANVSALGRLPSGASLPCNIW
jgi:hypothetical protein